MGTFSYIAPLLAVLISLVALVPIILSGKRPMLREFWTFLAAALKFLIVLSMLPGVLNGQVYELTLVHMFPGVSFAFRVDAFGMLFALVASSLWILTSCYSIGYMRSLKEHSQTRFFCCFALALSATIGVAFSANLFTMYIFYEMLSLSTYPLVTHHQDQEAKSAGRKYLLYILGTSIGLVLPAMIITYSLTGTLDFATQGFLAGKASPLALTALLFMMTFGFAKAGIMPFHSWLPGAMVAPTPVSALLHAVAVVKVGVFCIVRVISGVFGLDLLGSLHLSSFDLGTVLCIIASITILVSSLIALSQDNLKRMLAFSTIGQLSYIILGAALLSSHALFGGILHIAVHAFGKITLFFCAGAIFVATGKKYISQMHGLGRKMPFTFGAFFIGSMSVIGLPPTAGLISKLHLAYGALEADKVVFLVVLLVSSLLNAGYFFPVVFKAFFKKSAEEQTEGIEEAPLCCVVPLCITALISAVLFFCPQPFYDLAQGAVKAMIGG